MPKHVIFLLIALPALAFAERFAAGERDGEVHTLNDGSFMAWDAESEQWLSPDNFWVSFAARERGKNWGGGRTFPPYDSVNEHDTFLLEVDEGPCLMYFFHTRWRRANDVWRWDPVFNDYGGCANVFD
jgi:hypothetical protein